MARSVWSGSLTLGMLNIRAHLYKAVDSVSSIEFRQLNAETMNRIRYIKVDGQTGDPVDASHIVRGYEYEKDHFIVVSDEELAEISPRRSSVISIERFCPLSDIPEIHLDTPYYIGTDESTAKAYKLLATTLAKNNLQAICRIVLRNKEHLASIRHLNGRLVMITLNWASQVRDFPTADTEDALAEQEMVMMETLVHALVDTEYSIRNEESDYNEQLQQLLDAKANGEEVVVVAQEVSEETHQDIFEALRASLQQIETTIEERQE